MATSNWTEEQITIVLYEYCRKPFGQFSGRKQFVVDLGKLIGRTPGAIVRKVGNLASFDPQMKARGVGGLGHTAKLDEIV
jgi:putative restriction endonuclease